MPKYASVTAQRAELLALYREGVIDAGVLQESLASLARETADPPAAPAPTPVLSKSAKKRAKKKKKAAQASTRAEQAQPEQTLSDEEVAHDDAHREGGLVDEPPHVSCRTYGDGNSWSLVCLLSNSIW